MKKIIEKRLCPDCKGTDLIITEKKFHGEIFYLLHHKNYDLENRECGILVYDWNKDNLINYTTIKSSTKVK